jgi:hypothetical protein
MSGSSVEYSTGTNTKGANDPSAGAYGRRADDTRHEATEARHGGIEGERGPGRDVGDPGPRDQLGQTGAGRGDAGDGAHGGRERYAGRA